LLFVSNATSQFTCAVRRQTRGATMSTSLTDE